MSRVYERHLLASENNALQLEADERPQLFRIEFPPAGLIKKLVVKQKGGTSCAFKVNLYNRQVEALMNPGVASSEAPDLLDKELAKIIPEQSAIAGAAVSLLTSDGYAYRTQGDSFSVPDRAVYLEINATNPAGVTTWEVAIACIPERAGI